MSNTLILKKMGCDFFKNDFSTAESDIGNYRVRTAFRDKRGDVVHGDFCRLPKNNALATDLQVGCSRYVIREAIDHKYTKESLLDFVNSVSAIHYDNVKIVEEWPEITRENAKAGQVYAFCAHWQYVTKVWTLTDEEMRENNLYCRTRVECIDFNGRRSSYGL